MLGGFEESLQFLIVLWQWVWCCQFVCMFVNIKSKQKCQEKLKKASKCSTQLNAFSDWLKRRKGIISFSFKVFFFFLANNNEKLLFLSLITAHVFICHEEYNFFLHHLLEKVETYQERKGIKNKIIFEIKILTQKQQTNNELGVKRRTTWRSRKKSYNLWWNQKLLAKPQASKGFLLFHLLIGVVY